METKVYNAKVAPLSNTGHILRERGSAPPDGRQRRPFTTTIPGVESPSLMIINLDWLAINVRTLIAPPSAEELHRDYGDGIVATYLKRGTAIYMYSWKILYNCQEVATMHTTPRMPVIPGNNVKIEILNHVLYSSELETILSYIFKALNIKKVSSFSRVDIAIDGCKHIYDFLNLYATKQVPAPIERLGQASFDAKCMTKDYVYKNFKIGRGAKQLVVYEKMQELEISNKNYIRDIWQKSGIDDQKEVWRCELRLLSKSLKEIKDIDISCLLDHQYLAQLFATHCEKWFHFVQHDTYDKKKQRKDTATDIDILQFRRLKINLLEKIPRAIVKGVYKVKLSIHHCVMAILSHMYSAEEAAAALNAMFANISIYGVGRWFHRKLLHWMREYCLDGDVDAIPPLLYQHIQGAIDG